ncbi:MAG TPA: dihydrofolate reductase family protein [Kribbella sp.]|nr:dihydrofolate reductase family protein [Kribbella sp.]
MSQVRIHNFAISLDGFGTGEGQSRETPFGHAGERLHEWYVDTQYFHAMDGLPGVTQGVDNAFAEQHERGIGAEIMGANKFGPPGWQDDADWTGWWGPNPPFHSPVFVLTHRPRASVEMEGGTTYHFVDATPEDVLAQARAAAGDGDVRLGGGATVIREFLKAGLVDYMHIAVVPILLGRGVRLWDDQESLEQHFDIQTVSSPSGVTHLTFTRKS